MGSAARQGRHWDRGRDNPGENTRHNQAIRDAKNAARRERRMAARLGVWGQGRRPRSSRLLRAHVLEQVRTFEKSAGGDPVHAANLLSGFVSHHKMERVRKMASLKSRKEQDASDLLVNNLRVALQDVKNTHSQNQVSAKRTALDMTVSMELADRRLGSATSRVLGLNRRLMKTAALRREHIMNSPASSRNWATKGRAIRSDKLPPELIQYIKDFWHNNTRPSPKAKDVIKHHQKHYLTVTQTEMYVTFREHYRSENQFPLIACPGQRFFESLKPFYIYAETDRSVCCCKYHVEMDLLKRGFNQLRKVSHGRSCACDCALCMGGSGTSGDEDHHQDEEQIVLVDQPTGGVGSTIPAPPGILNGSSHTIPSGARIGCQAHTGHYDSVRAMCSATLCPKVMHEPLNLELHRMPCVQGMCEDCGFDRKFPFCEEFERGVLEGELAWTRFEQVHNGFNKKGKEKFRPALVQKSTTKNDFMDYLKQKVPEFVKHDFVYRWEDLQFKKSMAIFPVGCILSVIDFAENYSMAPQDEIQSDHWTSTQVTILVHIVYYHLPESTYSDRKIGKVCHYYVSDDKKHDSAFVQHAFARLDEWLHEEGVEYSQHWVWSDGAPTHFKNRVALYFVYRYPHIKRGKRMIWSFFGPGHGKGEHDGMGAVVKRWLRQYQLDREGVFLENAESVVNLLRLNLSLGSFSTFRKRAEHQSTIHRVFHYVPEGAVDRAADLDCEKIAGVRNKMFQVMGASQVDHTLLQSRPLACFCPTCVYRSFANCMNIAYTGGEWVVHKLVPTGPLLPGCEVEEWEDDDNMAMGITCADYDHLAHMLTIGSYFAVRNGGDSPEGVPYWILQCTSPRETLIANRTHSWDSTVFTTGEVVVTGTYMHVVDRNPLKYKCERKRAPATIYSHLLLSVGIPLELETQDERTAAGRAQRMTSGNMVYNLPAEHHEGILDLLAEPSDIFGDNQLIS